MASPFSHSLMEREVLWVKTDRALSMKGTLFCSLALSTIQLRSSGTPLLSLVNLRSKETKTDMLHLVIQDLENDSECVEDSLEFFSDRFIFLSFLRPSKLFRR